MKEFLRIFLVPGAMAVQTMVGFAQPNPNLLADKLYEQGVELQYKMTVESQNNAIIKFKNAKKIYNNMADRTKCDNAIMESRANIKRLEGNSGIGQEQLKYRPCYLTGTGGRETVATFKIGSEELSLVSGFWLNTIKETVEYLNYYEEPIVIRTTPQSGGTSHDYNQTAAQRKVDYVKSLFLNAGLSPGLIKTSIVTGNYTPQVFIETNAVK